MRWRWPLILASAVLVINVVGLNVEWFRMKREAAALRATMTQIYKSTYPKDTVIVDPVAQMKQKIAASQRESGQAAPDDFTPLTASFGVSACRAEDDLTSLVARVDDALRVSLGLY